MTQESFGEWLAKGVGRSSPIPKSAISSWESGCHSPNKAIINLCSPLVAQEISKEVTKAIENGEYSNDWLVDKVTALFHRKWLKK